MSASVHWLKISSKGSGLTNQLFTFITGIIIAKQNGLSKVVTERFYIDAFRDTSKPISQIIDLVAFNKFLVETYNLEIIDMSTLTVNVYYGIDDKFIELTPVWPAFLPAYYNLNLIAGDPVPEVKKKLCIQYKNDKEVVLSLIYNEHEITTDLHTPPIFSSLFGWINRFDKKMFENILRNITFHNSYQQLAEMYTSNICKLNGGTINIIHIRLESDCTHWSNMNNLSESEYRRLLEDKYISAIVENFDKNDGVLVLSYDYNNRVIEYLNNNGYSLLCPQKYNDLGREENAIIDFLIAKKLCTNAFIGNFNLDKLNGSTFSYLIYLHLKPSIQYIYIDIDNIKAPAVKYLSIYS
jgi:hypothetical protein